MCYDWGMTESSTYIVTPPMRKYEIIYKGQLVKTLDAQLANTVSLPGQVLFVVNDNPGDNGTYRVVGQFATAEYSWAELPT